MTVGGEWDAEIAEMRRRRDDGLEMGGKDAVAKQHAHGKLSARERIAKLLGNDSFEEYGALTGVGTYNDEGRLERFTPSAHVVGIGAVGGRRTVVVADDFTLRGGSSEAVVSEKWVYAERYAYEYGLPLIRLVDSAGGSVKLLDKQGRTKIPGYVLWPLTGLLGRVPCVGIAMGSCAGLAALRVAASHFSIMVRGTSQVFAGGPPVVKRALGVAITKEDLGGYEIHQASGVINNVAGSEQDALELARRFLSYLPQNVWEQSKPVDATDDPSRRESWLNDAIPHDSKKVFNVRKIINKIVDIDSFFELSPKFGGSVVTGFARLNGFTVGVFAENPIVMAGSMTRAAAEKMEKFIDLCDTFHLPIVHLVDQPGVMPGLEAERAGTLSAVIRLGAAIEQSTVPWLVIVLRRCFGLGGALLGPLYGQHGDALPHRFAWPSARWGSIPIEGGVAAAYKTEIAMADDPAAKLRELETHYHNLESPFRTAEKFGIVDIIEPARTRSLLCNWVIDAYRVAKRTLGVKRRTMR